MIGREVEAHFVHGKSTPGDVALEVCGLRGEKTFGVDLSIRYGEVLGLAGLMGSGRSELVRLLFGIDRATGGTIRVDGRPVRIRSPRDALDCGIVLVPEDRKREGLVLIQSVAFNLAIPWLDRWIRGIRVDRPRRDAIVRRATDEFGIRASSPAQCIGTLSGGNQQKAMVGRWMEQRPKVLILDEPTRGVDVGAREEMFRIIGRLVASGMAVLLISSDLEEVLRLSHRVAMLRDGRIVGQAPAAELSMQRIMEHLTGTAAHGSP
jgi:ABC-type sugar transport system ATPase subunit